MARGPAVPDEDIADAMVLYRQLGPAETARRSGYLVGTLKRWAFDRDVRYDPKFDPAADDTAEFVEIEGTTSVTTDQPLVVSRPSRAGAETGIQIKARMERVSAFHQAKQAQMRASLRTRLLERAHDALDRMDGVH